MKKCGLEIVSIGNARAHGAGNYDLSIGDTILEVNGSEIRDQLDFHFMMPQEGQCRLRIMTADGTVKEVRIDAAKFAASGIRFAPLDFKKCRNKCIFCFVDQMPGGLRPGLYFKDEDYRLGFLFGNYTTLNDITNAEIERIITQQLGPQYVSVHTVDEKLRETIFGRPMKREILETLKLLAEGGIEIHAQVVLCPGLNDGRFLDQSIEALESIHENVRSLSVVPVGITKYRKKHPLLRRYRYDEYSAIINRVENFQKKFLSGRRKSRFVFLADEWYLGSGTALPRSEEYEEFHQIDNGVGMTRKFIDDIENDIKRFSLPGELDHIVLVTGNLGQVVIRDYVFPILKRHGVVAYPKIAVVKNAFFGEEVTVSGLLVYDDILSSLKMTLLHGNGRSVFIPPNSVNFEGKFLDGPGPGDLEEALGKRVSIPEPSLVKEFNSAGKRGGLDG